MLNELREKAKEFFNSNKWMTSITEGERTVCVHSDGLYCSSINKFDPEFITNDTEKAINYLYPEF